MRTVTQQRLKELLSYDPETGIFVWLVNRTNGIKAGDVAGCMRGPYLVISVDNVAISAQRLAYVYMTGEMPIEYVDHVNCMKTDNRWDNLRAASNMQNQRNKGGTGSNCETKNITYVKARDKFQVGLKINGKSKFFGYFQDLELADLVATEARDKYHGEFARHF